MPDASSIADFPDYGDTANAGSGMPAPRWPFLRRAMAAETARWPRLAPAGAAFAVLHLGLARALTERPDCAALLARERILAGEEARRLEGFRFAKRRAEWLGGRLAAKAALADFLGTGEAAPAGLVIENDGHGRPFARNDGVFPTLPHLSISHSGDFAAALAAPRPCGLDVQAIRPNLARVRDYFADAEETALCGAEAADEAWLARVWAAKEAVKKCRYPAEPTFMERIKITGRAGEILLCRLADTGETVPARTALQRGHAWALCCDAP